MSRIRTSIVVVAVAGVSATAAVPTPAEAAPKQEVRKAFNSAFSALKSGNTGKFCRSFTKSALKKAGGVKKCQAGVSSIARNLRGGSLKVRSVSASGSSGSVRWTGPKRSWNTTFRKESGKWKISKLLG